MNDPFDLNFQNTAGIASAFLIHHIDIGSFPDKLYDEHKLDGEVIILPTGEWIPIYQAADGCQFTQEEQTVKGDSVWKLTFDFFIPSSNEDFSYYQTHAHGRKVVIDFTDRDGVRKIAGTKEEPLRITQQFKTQRTMAQLKGCQFRAEGICSQQAYFYDPDTPAIVYAP